MITTAPDLWARVTSYEEMDAQGVKLVRFADDFVILCKSERKAKSALSHCIRVLDAHGLHLHADGTRIVNFEKGFDFIGNLFLRTLSVKTRREPKIAAAPVKSEVTDDGVIQLETPASGFAQGRRVLYVLDPRHTLGIRNRSFSVRREDGRELIAIPNKRVARIEIGPDVTFDPQVIVLAMETSTDLALLDAFGQTKGMVVGRESRHASMHFTQAQAILDPALRLQIARKTAHSRVASQRAQLMRLNRRRQSDKVVSALRDLKRLKAAIADCGSVEGVMGFEGAASAVYWPALGALCVLGCNGGFKRSRPARDPLNAAINYLTGILERDVRAAIHSVGRHAGFAFLHGTRDRHDGLVFDGMEPFRAALTEGLPVYLFNARRLRPDMFVTTTDARTEITTEGRRALVEGYETAVARRVSKPGGKGRIGWRAMMVHQCQTLKRCINARSEAAFLPFVMEA